MNVLVVNAGSSSLKLSVIDEADASLAATELGSPWDAATAAPLHAFLGSMPPVGAVGHRIVHGGPSVVGATVVDDDVRRQLEKGSAIAPLHVPAALAILDTVRAGVAVPNVVCLDTAFHASMPAAASTYAVPARWRTEYGIRRFGFHGLSYAWALRRSSVILGRPGADLQLLVAHLGSGASVCAIRDGRGADTTMGFTPLEGLVMGTRSGTVDPGALAWLQTAHGLDAKGISEALEHESGFRGLCGTADAREVLARASAGDEAAVLARDVFVHRAAAGIAAMAVSLERVDALVFTGGIGEHSAEIREQICRELAVIAIGTVLVVEAREDLQIAAEVRGLLAG